MGSAVLCPNCRPSLRSRDLVFVEERGTRYSKPFLSCPEYDAKNIAVAKGEMAYTDPSWFKDLPGAFQGAGHQPQRLQTPARMQRMSMSSPRPWATAHSNYYGVSYGTLLGQYVIAQAGQHKAKLRSVILDGVVRPDIDFNLAGGHSLSFALRNLFHACAQDQACGQAYPNLERKVLAIVDQLNQKPVPLTLTTPVSKQRVATQLDGNAFATALLYALLRPYSGNTARGTSIPKYIQAASQGDFGWAADYLSGDLESSGGSAKGMYHTVLCARAQIGAGDTHPGLAATLSATHCLGHPRKRNGGEGLRHSPSRLETTLCLRKSRDPHAGVERRLRPSDSPALRGSRGKEPEKVPMSTPSPAWGTGSFFPPPGMPATDCVMQMATDFLVKPTQAPNSSCLTQIKPLFVVE